MNCNDITREQSLRMNSDHVPCLKSSGGSLSNLKSPRLGEWGWDRALLFNEYVGLVWEDEKVLEMDGGDGCPTM